MARKIISANYRDRESPFRWLVRDEGQPAAEAVPCKSVEAVGVQFVETWRKDLPFSLEEESGFNCSVVAVAEDAIANGFEGQEITAPEARYTNYQFPEFKQMAFVRGHFLPIGYVNNFDPELFEVKKVQALRLEETGEIFAAI